MQPLVKELLNVKEYSRGSIEFEIQGLNESAYKNEYASIEKYENLIIIIIWICIMVGYNIYNSNITNLTKN